VTQEIQEHTSSCQQAKFGGIGHIRREGSDSFLALDGLQNLGFGFFGCIAGARR